MQLAYCVGAEPGFIYFEGPIKRQFSNSLTPVEDRIWSGAMRGILDFLHSLNLWTCKFICTNAVTCKVYLNSRGCCLYFHHKGLDEIEGKN